MDPLTIVATVASIAQLAQAALALSKTLYNVGSTIASASDDIKILADDLKTFSQSLSLLSRLLEDSKAWYSDDVYLLTAKIIRDCADLYVKIDQILVKLGGNGKSNWKFRVKFVYKESQIKKLMTRLRDMKGTLATILMSLQVDLQLSLLNISSASKIQRSSETPLQPETIQTLKDAQKTVESTAFLPRYTAQPEESIRFARRLSDILSREVEEVAAPEPPEDIINPPISSKDLELNNSTVTLRFETDIPANFMTLSVQPDDMLPFFTKEAEPPAPRPATTTISAYMMSSHIIPTDQTSNKSIEAQHSARSVDIDPVTTLNLKSSSSLESFKSAVSTQNSIEHFGSQVEAVQSVLHAFRIALEALDSLVAKRFPGNDIISYPAVNDLKLALHEGKHDIEQRHKDHYKCHGQLYIQCFTSSHSSELEHLSSILMKEVVTPLHIYSADHIKLDYTNLHSLVYLSQRYCGRALNLLDSAELLVQPDMHSMNYGLKKGSLLCEFPGCSKVCSGSINLARHYSRIHTSLGSRRITQASQGPVSVHFQEYWSQRPERPTQPLNSVPRPQKDSELTLPFIGYTFKRLDDKFNFNSTGLAVGDSPSNDANRMPSDIPSGYRDSPKMEDSFYSGVDLSDSPEEVGRRSTASEKRSKSRSRSRSGNLHIKKALGFATAGMAAAAAAKYVKNRKNNTAELHRGRSRTRSRSHHRSCRSQYSLSPTHVRSRSNNLNNKAASIARAGVATAAVAGIIEHSRNEPPGGLAGAAVAGLYEDRKAKEDAEYVKWVRRRRRSRRARFESAHSDPGAATILSNHHTMTRGSTEQRGRNIVGGAALGANGAEITTTARIRRYREGSRSRSLSRSILDRCLDEAYTTSPSSSLWQVAFQTLSDTESKAFMSLEREFKSVFLFDTSNVINDTSSGFSKVLSERLKKLPDSLSGVNTKWDAIKATWENIVKIVLTVEEKLGLEVAAIGWGCVYISLSIYQPLFSATGSSVSSEAIEIITESFTQLQDVVATIARYAVMENLYNRSGGSLSLKSEYQSSLLSLCTTVLRYFEASFIFARNTMKWDEAKDADQVVAETQRNLLMDNYIICEVLIHSIKQQDRDCQGFKVVVETREESESDISYGDWEQIEIEDHEIGVDDI